MESAPPPSSALCGREEQTTLLEGVLAGALHGRGGLVLVSGDAGMGKSALLDEAARRARERGFSVAIGRAWEVADAPPLYALRPFLRSVGLDPSAVLDPTQGSFAVFEAILEGLVHGSAKVPQFWALEDLHCVDEQTMDALRFLARPLRALRSVLLVTTRLHDPRLDQKTLDKIARLRREGTEIELPALHSGQVAELAQSLCRRSLGPKLLAELVDASGGNPLFVTELARSLTSLSEELPRAIPATLRHLILERVRFLSIQTRRALDAACVLGRDFSAALVASMLEVQPARVIDELLPALRSGIILELEPGLFRFSHVLVRDAFYDQLAPGERAALHFRAAWAFSRGSVEGDALFTSAQHALKGVPHAPFDFVVPLVDRAVAILTVGRAFDRAYSLRKQADAAAAQGLLPIRPPEQLLGSARVARDAGQFTEARAMCAAVLTQARADQKPELLARAALELGAVLRPGVVDPLLVDALTEAERALTTDHAALRVLVRARRAAALQPAPDPAVPVQMALEAIEEARCLEDAAVLREVLFYAGSALIDFAPASTRLACAEEFYETARATHEHARALHATVRLALEHSTLGNFQAFHRDVERALTISEQLGREPSHRWRPLLLASMRASAAGRFDEADRLIVEVEQLANLCDDPALQVTLRSHQLMTLHLQRRDEEADEKFRQVSELYEGIPIARAMLALIRLNLSVRREHLEQARRDWSNAEPYLEQYKHDPDFLALVGEGVALVGSERTRREVRQLLVGGASELSMGHMMMVYEGPTRRVVGLLDASLGETGAALEHLLAALELARERGHRTWEAQLAYDLGRLLCQSGESVQGAAHLEMALELAQTLGMPGLADAASRHLGRFRTEAPPPARQAAPEFALEKDGEFFRVTFRERSHAVRATRGMQLLAKLWERRGEEIHVLVLSGDDEPIVDGGAGELLDQRALQNYRQRLLTLDQELDQAEEHLDRARIERLGIERDALVSELSRAVGLGGRIRRAGSVTERARVNVQKRLKQALATLTELDPDFGPWLTGAVRTGTYCSFRA